MKLIKLLSLLLITLGITQCASKKLVTNPPFTITKATYTNWVGGIEGVSGINVTVYYTAPKTIAFDSIYYKGKKAAVSFKGNDAEKIVMAQFNTSSVNSKKDLQLQKDTAGEYGNTLPNVTSNFPFELKDNEAIVSYKENNTIKYFKITNLTQGKKVMYQ